MEHRPLGSSGLSVSAMSVGSWLTLDFVEEDVGVDVLRSAMEGGVTFFDDARYDDRTGKAPIKTGYSEVRFGELWRKGGWDRNDVVLGNKAWLEFYPKESILEETEGSLARLGMDFIDVMYAVPPPKTLPMPKLVAEMSDLVGTGKVRSWGGLNWNATQIAEAHEIAEQKGLARFSAVQLPYSLLYRAAVENRGMQEICKKANVSIVASYGLHGGWLTNKYADGSAKPEDRMTTEQVAFFARKGVLAMVAKLGDLARELEMTSAQLALAYCLNGPHVASVTFGAKSREQVEENLGALYVAHKLDAEVIRRIRTILQPKRR